jgi:hypothetical protein
VAAVVRAVGKELPNVRAVLVVGVVHMSDSFSAQVI